MALYDYAMGNGNRDGIWALTCENGCRPERILDCDEIVSLLHAHLQFALQSETVDEDSESFDEDELNFLFEAARELRFPVIVQDIQSAHEDAFMESLRLEMEEAMFHEMTQAETAGTGSAGI